MIDWGELIIIILRLVAEYIFISQTLESLRRWFRDELPLYDDYNRARRDATFWLFLTVVWTGCLFADLMTTDITL